MKFVDNLIGKNENIDIPFSWRFFTKGKIRAILIYEDGTYSEHRVENSKDYTIKIKKRIYFLVPKCIIRAKISTIVYYFNNPLPIYFGFKHSELKFETEYLKNPIVIDSSNVRTIMESNLINKIYDSGGLTTKTFIIIAIIFIVVIFIILQASGTVDILGFFTGVK